MVVDVHSHFLPARYAAVLGAASAVPEVVRRAVLGASELRDLEARLALMDAAGVDVSVLSLPPPAALVADAARAAAVAAQANDDLLAAAAAYPGRFAVLVTLPVPDVRACLAELERTAAHPLATGVALITDSGRWDAAAPALEDVYAAAAQRGMPVMLHPGVEELPAAYGDWNIALALGAPVSSTLATLRLLLCGMLDRVGGLTPIVPHLGGTLPYLAQRVVDQCGHGDAARDPLHYLRERVLLDTCSYHRPALHCALETAGAERLLLGSDFPFRGGLDRCVADVAEAGLGAAEREAILGANAARHLRLGALRSPTIPTT